MKSFIKVFIIGLKYLSKKIFEEDHECLALFIICISFWIPYKIVKDKSLYRNAVYTVGVITKINQGRNDRKIYEFYVNNKKVTGSTGCGGLSKITVGDSLYIVYDSINPNNNYIMGYFEYRLDRSKLPDTVYHRQEIDKMRRPIK